MNATEESVTDSLPPTKNITPKCRTVFEKLKNVQSKVTVEPMVLFYVLPNILVAFTTQMLRLEKACRVNLNYDANVCDALYRRDIANFTKEENSVQELVAKMVGWKGFLHNSILCVLILFWGSWSDRYCRRKPCIIIPTIGNFLTAISLLLCYHFKEISLEILIVFESVFIVATGSYPLFSIGVFSYIAEATNEINRTFRIGIFSIFIVFVSSLATASQFLLDVIGYYGTFSLSAVLNFIGILYAIFLIKEIRQPNPMQISQKLITKNQFIDFFDKRHVQNTFATVFGNGENKRRLRIILTVACLILSIGPFVGEREMLYLFTRYKFNWDVNQQTLFNTFTNVLSSIGNTIVTFIFLRVFHLNDSIIGIISCISKLAGNILMTFSNNSMEFYLGALLAVLYDGALIAIRSIASKIVNGNEQGKLNSILFFCEILTTMFYTTIYSELYKQTLNTLPSAFILLGGLLIIPAICIHLWLYRFHRKRTNTQIFFIESAKEVNKKLDNDINIDVIKIGTPLNLYNELDNNKCHNKEIIGDGLVNKAFIGE